MNLHIAKVKFEVEKEREQFFLLAKGGKKKGYDDVDIRFSGETQLVHYTFLRISTPYIPFTRVSLTSMQVRIRIHIEAENFWSCNYSLGRTAWRQLAGMGACW